ncbi:hypothetical protein FHL15_002794 [Xylaria flabelliformis]|uniref:Uncharacterized protein n=1 Tax=Xylaria flabelliformis TaxID=2512241 RepID=A0A553I8L5_9PEZI|nr:hypothetical protein FHL15_002794 [Xylaria flabelliformis]
MARAGPLSPWAQRFGHDQDGRNAFVDDVVHHSGFAPSLPSLHPKYYADKPPVDNARTASGLDYLFASEAFQNYYLKGSYSWMVGPLMRYVRFSERTGLISGGHRAADNDPVDPGNAAALMPLINPPDSTDSANPVNLAGKAAAENQEETLEDLALKIFHSERVQVDESKWFGFLRKDRWLDWDRPQTLFDGGNWSVDNPKVWEILSISIELLDRVVKALVADKHVMLEAVLYGAYINWEDAYHTPPPFKGAHLLLSLEHIRMLCNARQAPCVHGFIALFTPGHYAARLEHLLREQTWTFVEDFLGSGTWGVTLGQLGDLIGIDVGPIRTLMAGNITIAERCMLQFSLMTTMLHEMIHALNRSRKVDQTWPAYLPPISFLNHPETSEPLLNDDAAVEMGFAAEQRIFGGQLVLGPMYCDDLPFGAYISDWPSPFEGSPDKDIVADHWAFQPGRIMHITRLPALFTSKILSAEFWDDATIARKSANHFHCDRLFVSDTISAGRDSDMVYSAARLHPNAGVMPKAGELEMIADWLHRKWDWEQRRAGWFEQSWQEWRRTPWSDVRSRQRIIKFGRKFGRRNRIECEWIALTLLGAVECCETRDIYIQNLPPYKEDNKWVFHAMGLLMLAALPIRNYAIESDENINRTWRFISREGTAERLKGVKESYHSHRIDERRIPASVLHDPLGRPGPVEADNFYQEDYLDVLGRLVNYLARNDVAVSHPWLQQIMNTAHDLRRQRRDVSRSKLSWAEWRFTIPTYDTSLSRFQYGRWTVQA